MTASIVSANQAAGQANDPLEAELDAYNHAFCELELPWRWDASTLRHLLSIAADRDVVGTYVERNQAHLLRAYEKAFLRDLVEHATQPRFVYSHRWRQWDLVMWDNRQTMHRVTRFDETRVRDMRRTTVAGDAMTVAQAA